MDFFEFIMNTMSAMKKYGIVLVGIVLGYSCVAMLISGSPFLNPTKLVEGIAFTLAFGFGVPKILAMFCGVSIVLVAIIFWVYILRVLVAKISDNGSIP